MAVNREEAQNRAASTAKSKYAKLKMQAQPKAKAPGLLGVPSERVLQAIAKVMGNGDAIMFSRTSDGGAVCIVLLEDKERTKLYATTQTEMEAIVEAILS